MRISNKLSLASALLLATTVACDGKSIGDEVGSSNDQTGDPSVKNSNEESDGEPDGSGSNLDDGSATPSLIEIPSPPVSLDETCEDGAEEANDCYDCSCKDGEWLCISTCDTGEDTESDPNLTYDPSDSSNDSTQVNENTYTKESVLPEDCEDGDIESDDCNTCFCSGGNWACTEIACQDSDGEYDACGEKSCGEPCTVCDPEDFGCAETLNLKFCDNDGQCRGEEPICEYDPCDGKQCGDTCSYFGGPGDSARIEPAFLSYCSNEGECSLEEPVCTDNAIKLEACTGDEAKDQVSIDEATIYGDILNVPVSFGGGCAEHLVTSCILKESPGEILLGISHEANGDPCEAWLSETVSIDLSSLGLGGPGLAKLATPPDVMIHVADMNGKVATSVGYYP